MHLSKDYISNSFRSVVGCGQSKLVQTAQCTWQLDNIRSSVACHITSDLDFNKGGCVKQI